MNNLPQQVAAFIGPDLIAVGSLADVAVKVQQRAMAGEPVLVFNDENGRVVDLDLRGAADDVAQRYACVSTVPDEVQKGRGRPRLGVVPREVTLLPRHWDWLASQPGGSSASLRRLVDEARKADGGRTEVKSAQERGYRFLTAMAGDLPYYEEAVRALFASDTVAMERHMAAWPVDIRDYALRLLDTGSEMTAKD